MDCREFKEMLDSYFCQELAVETNHAMLGHAEHCPPCRREMASRRNLRETLQRACARDQMSDEACERLRERLRAEASQAQAGGWRERWANLFTLRLARPIAATAGILILMAGAATIYRLTRIGPLPPGDSIFTAQLSQALMAEAADDHQRCASHWLSTDLPALKTDQVRDFDPACAGLEQAAATGAQGLRLRAMHVCGFTRREFVHLVYTRDRQLISLLVTARDSQALDGGPAPPNASPTQTQSRMQRSLQQGLPLEAYQTAKHVVLVVSDLPETENEALAQQLASPVLEHLRRFEGQSAMIAPRLGLPELPELKDVIAKVRGGELR